MRVWGLFLGEYVGGSSSGPLENSTQKERNSRGRTRSGKGDTPLSSGLWGRRKKKEGGLPTVRRMGVRIEEKGSLSSGVRFTDEKPSRRGKGGGKDIRAIATSFLYAPESGDPFV